MHLACYHTELTMLECDENGKSKINKLEITSGVCFPLQWASYPTEILVGQKYQINLPKNPVMACEKRQGHRRGYSHHQAPVDGKGHFPKHKTNVGI